MTGRGRIFVMKILAALRKIKEQTKASMVSEDQKKAIEIGKQQFQKLVKHNLTIPVVFL